MGPKLCRAGRALTFAFFVVVAGACAEAPTPGGTFDGKPTKENVPVEQQQRDGLVDGKTLKFIALDDVIRNVKPGGVLILSEQHGNSRHYMRQRIALLALENTHRCKVSVGLEFLAWDKQSIIDSYFDGQTAETDFLNAVVWGKIPFAYYREQALFPRRTEGRLLGINAPSSLTRKISKSGMEALTAEELALLPPNFTLGNDAYKARFVAVMQDHVPAQALDRYFAAQSVWDETMAWKSSEYLAANPGHCLAIVVGDFHAAWGGGLPDRLRARGVKDVVVISQFETDGVADADVQAEIVPDAKVGARADAVWLSNAALPQ